MFKEERKSPMFDLSMIGDINVGRTNLGPHTTVASYRLMQYTLRDILICELGVKKADGIFFKAGEQAGIHFYKNVVTKKESLVDFMSDLQGILRESKLGILRIEKADLDKSYFVLTVAEDLDCSGLPVCDEVICSYDEGFIKGLLLAHTGKEFDVKEVDCWCSGGRVCRFEIKLIS